MFRHYIHLHLSSKGGSYSSDFTLRENPTSRSPAWEWHVVDCLKHQHSSSPTLILNNTLITTFDVNLIQFDHSCVFVCLKVTLLTPCVTSQLWLHEVFAPIPPRNRHACSSLYVCSGFRPPLITEVRCEPSEVFQIYLLRPGSRWDCFWIGSKYVRTCILMSFLEYVFSTSISPMC